MYPRGDVCKRVTAEGEDWASMAADAEDVGGERADRLLFAPYQLPDNRTFAPL